MAENLMIAERSYLILTAPLVYDVWEIRAPGIWMNRSITQSMELRCQWSTFVNLD